MKGELNRPGQPYRKEDFDILEWSLESGIRERFHDLCHYGVLSDSQMGGETGPFWVSQSLDGTSVNVGTGIAMGPQDSTSVSADWPGASGAMGDAMQEPVSGGKTVTTAERIVLDTAQAASAWARSEVTPPIYFSGPFKRSDDGLGGTLPTPQSTGALGVPVSILGANYTGDCHVWLAYLLTLDDTVFTQHALTNQRIYYRKRDGFEIMITGSAVPPDNDARFFRIASFHATNGVIDSAIDQSMMPLYRSRLNRVGIAVDSAKSPAAYVDGQTGLFLDDHINGIGSGTVTSNNVHGIAAADIDGFGYGTIDHHIAAHADGIKNPSANPNTLLITTSDVPALGQRIIRIAQMVSPEAVVVGGELKTEVFPKISGATSDAYVPFSGADVGGTYTIYLSVSGAECVAEKVKSTEYSLVTVSNIVMGEVLWDSATPELSIISDNRANLFGLLSTNNIQRRSVTSDKLSLNAVNTDNIVDLSVTNPKIASVEASKITVVGGGLTAGQISSVSAGGVTGPGLVRYDLIGPGITGGQIANDTVTVDNLAPELKGVLTPQVPVGTMVMYAGLVAPSGWAMCWGQDTFPTYPNLAALGIAKIPDMRGRMPIGVGTHSDSSGHSRSFTLGVGDLTGLGQTEVGEYSHTLLTPEMPTHTHTYNYLPMNNSGGSEGPGHHHNGSTPETAPTGGDGAHNTLPPYMGINFIIKY